MNGYMFIRIAKRLNYHPADILRIINENGIPTEFYNISDEPPATDEEMLNHYAINEGKGFAGWL